MVQELALSESATFYYRRCSFTLEADEAWAKLSVHLTVLHTIVYGPQPPVPKDTHERPSREERPFLCAQLMAVHEARILARRRESNQGVHWAAGPQLNELITFSRSLLASNPCDYVRGLLGGLPFSVDLLDDREENAASLYERATASWILYKLKFADATNGILLHNRLAFLGY